MGLKLSYNSKSYLLFQFVIVLYNIMLADSDFVSNSSNMFGHLNLSQYNHLQSFFAKDYDVESSSSFILSDEQIQSILSFAFHISSAMLMSSGDMWKLKFEEALGIIKQDWDKEFYKSAAFVFNGYQKKFGHLPKYKQFIKLTEGQ